MEGERSLEDIIKQLEEQKKQNIETYRVYSEKFVNVSDLAHT